MAAASAARDPGAKTRITVLGATGSIGQSLADLIQRNPDSYEVVALVANRNAAGLADMAKARKWGMNVTFIVDMDDTLLHELFRKHHQPRNIALALLDQYPQILSK